MTIAAAGTIQGSTSSASRGQTTRKDRIIYWTTTGIVSAVMVFSIINFTLLQGVPFPEGGFVHLHLPNYFRIELTIAKTLGVLALLIPSVPTKIKEFAYFGFGITLISGGIAHLSVGDASRNVLFILDPLGFFVVLVVSYVYFEKLTAAKVAV
jgi:DoxX-like protein